jgi:hypothetical protein
MRPRHTRADFLAFLSQENHKGRDNHKTLGYTQCESRAYLTVIDDFVRLYPMILPFRKFIAVMLVIWLPVLSGNALASSVAMQAMGSDCHLAGVQLRENSSQQLSAAQHHDQLAASHSHETDQHDQQDSSCKNCGVCHFACSGFLATLSLPETKNRLLIPGYTIFSRDFQSFTSAPPNPPPLARV